jgi:hypothetical protein
VTGVRGTDGGSDDGLGEGSGEGSGEGLGDGSGDVGEGSGDGLVGVTGSVGGRGSPPWSYTDVLCLYVELAPILVTSFRLIKPLG